MIKPFSLQFVVSATFKHLHAACERSIHKTILRIGEFGDDPDKSMEVLTTLSALHQIRAQLTNIERNIDGQFPRS